MNSKKKGGGCSQLIRDHVSNDDIQVYSPPRSFPSWLNPSHYFTLFYVQYTDNELLYRIEFSFIV
jgi:hypothetical protein